MTGKVGRGTARQTIRVPEDEWDEFGAACEAAGVERSNYLLETIRWAIGRPDTEPPVQLPNALPPGVTARIEGRTPREPKGRTVYSITAQAPVDAVTATIGNSLTLTPEPGAVTHVEVIGDLNAIEQARALLAAAGIEVAGSTS